MEALAEGGVVEKVEVERWRDEGEVEGDGRWRKEEAKLEGWRRGVEVEEERCSRRKPDWELNPLKNG